MKIKMELQQSESKDIVWFFPVIGEGFVDPHNVIALFMVFYKTYEQAYVAALQNNVEFIKTIDKMFDSPNYVDIDFTLEVINTAINLYKDEVAFRGKFEYILLGNKYMLKVEDFVKYADRVEINKFQAEYIRGV